MNVYLIFRQEPVTEIMKHGIDQGWLVEVLWHKVPFATCCAKSMSK